MLALGHDAAVLLSFAHRRMPKCHPGTHTPRHAHTTAELVSLGIFDRVHWQRSASGADVQGFNLEYSEGAGPLVTTYLLGYTKAGTAGLPGDSSALLWPPRRSCCAVYSYAFWVAGWVRLLLLPACLERAFPAALAAEAQKCLGIQLKEGG